VAPEPSSKPVRIVVGRYALYEAIAAGGMATVHYGRLLGPVGFSRTVAIKRLHAQFARDPEFVAMFLDEARLAARIRHPNVVPTLDVVATDNELFLVMDYVAGESFARLEKTASELGTVVPPRIVLSILCGVLRGLHAAHEATDERGEALGIVHRDVSPQNILVGTDGQARVLDFGVAKAAGRLQTTRKGTLKGKLGYMSPEQLRGKPIDRRTDIFAASTILWEGLTGTRLFRGDNEGEIVTKILEADIAPPSSSIVAGATDPADLATVRAVDAIVQKGLSTEPSDRYDTARAMAAAIEQAVTPAGVSEVGDWVERFAKDVLRARAQQVADIESQSAASQTHQGAVDEPAREVVGAATGASTRRHPPPVPPSRPSKDARTLTDPGDRSRPARSARALVAEDAPTRRLPTWAVIGVASAAVVLAASAGLGALRSPPHQAAPSAPRASASPATSPQPWAIAAPAAASTPAPSSASAATEPHANASAAPAPGRASTAPVPAPKPPVAATVAIPHHDHPAAHPSSSPSPARPASESSCTPPFTYDAEGVKHFKPECLQ
jgi:serine/threonine-protein kinase